MCKFICTFAPEKIKKRQSFLCRRVMNSTPQPSKQKEQSFDCPFVEKSIELSNDFFRDARRIEAFIEEFPTIFK